MASKIVQNEEIEEELEIGFKELGLHSSLVRALLNKSITKPTPIQYEAIRLIQTGYDVAVRAKTGSGKTLAYLLALIQNLIEVESKKSAKYALKALILVPTHELCKQVHSEAQSLVEKCEDQLQVVQLIADLSRAESLAEMTTVLTAGTPEVVVSTPACISKCLREGILQASSIKNSLSMIVLDEADLLLSYGFEDDIKVIIPHIPYRCQCLLISATSSSDVEKLRLLFLHNPRLACV